MKIRLLAAALLTVVLGLGITACGKDHSAPAPTTAPPTTRTAPPTRPPTTPPPATTQPPVTTAP